MSVLFILKFMGECAFYMAFASFFAGGHGFGALLPQYLLLCGTAVLCRLCARFKTPLRLLPLIALAALPLLPGGWVGMLFVLAPAAYLCYTAWKALYVPEQGRTIDAFLLLLKLIPLPLVFALIARGRDALGRYALPYLLLFLFSYVLLLRMLRHDPEILRQKKFMLLNTLELCSVPLAALVLFSPQLRRLLALVAGKLYQLIVAPILMLVSYIFVGFAWLVGKLIGEIPPLEQAKQPQIMAELGNPLEDVEMREPGAASRIILRILIALGILVLIALLIALFRKLLNTNGASAASHVGERRELIEEPLNDDRALRRWNARTPRAQVRYWYRKYLLLARSRGAELPESLTTAEQRGRASFVLPKDAPAQDRLRALYLAARYADADPTHEQAREAHRLYDEIRGQK